jgi:hypothetical protein
LSPENQKKKQLDELITKNEAEYRRRKYEEEMERIRRRQDVRS